MYSYLALISLTAQGSDQFSNAPIQEPPTQPFDLQHVAVKIDVNAENQTFRGTSNNLFIALKEATELRIHAGNTLNISEVTVNDKAATYKREDDWLIISVNAKPQEKFTVKTTFDSKKRVQSMFNDSGWHWIQPTTLQPDRTGFWTQGETIGNREWCPTWDYPNDFATSETIVTVPNNWSIIGNGDLVSKTFTKTTSTWHWKMKEPHATYLLSLVGGPLDIKNNETYKGKKLWYVVPKGKARLIPPSFSDTADMLNFFENITRVPYPWSKYAQSAMYDFGGGMENISATTLGESSLTDGRDGFRTMSSLNAHELAHQWTGDLVTCAHWGDIWLNESFATYLQILYFEHARGRAEYEHEIVNNTNEYLREARRYIRPLSTNRYPHPDSVFDSHAYPKGAVVLHSLRRLLGDEKFFKGFQHYLKKYANKPVTTANLQEAMSSGSGVDLSKFFEQWIYKPGHLVLEFDSQYNAESKTITVNVKQAQDKSKNVPIYEIPLEIGYVSGGKYYEKSFDLNQENQTFTLQSDQAPDVILLDPNRKLLREVRHTYSQEEQLLLAKFAPNAGDKSAYLANVIQSRNEDLLEEITSLISKDFGQFPIYRNIASLTQVKSEKLRPFWRSLLRSVEPSRAASAIAGLNTLKGTNPTLDEEDQNLVAKQFSPSENHAIVARMLQFLSVEKNLSFFQAVASSPESSSINVQTALNKLLEAKIPGTEPKVTALLKSTSYPHILVGAQLLTQVAPNEEIRAFEKKVLAGNDWTATSRVIRAIRLHKDKAMIPALEAIPSNAPQNIASQAKSALEELKS